MEALHATRIHNLETAYGVRIAGDAHPFAVELLKEYGSGMVTISGVEMAPINVVEEACKVLLKNLDPDCEETSLDWDEYTLDRAYVEVMELRKEKSLSCRTEVLPRVERELAQITRKIDCFMTKWSPILDEQKGMSGKRRELLLRLSNQLVSFITSTGSHDAEDFSGLPEQLNSILDDLEHTVNAAFREKLFVGPREIAQVASNMCELPPKCFYRPFELRMMLPKLEDLKSRLSEKLIELDGVVHKIGFALLKQKSVEGPLGSFLLLGPRGCGRSKLAESLAEEIYGGKDKYREYDVSLIKEPNHFKKLLMDLAKFKKNGSVVMFRNVEDASDRFTHEVLPLILKNGSLSDGQGTSVSFFNDIIFVSTHLGHEVFFDCECLHTTIPKLPFREILTEPALLHGGVQDEECHLHRFLSRVSNKYSSEFLDLFNDVLVFPWLSLQNHMAISRLQLRDTAESMGRGLNKPAIIYPSHAAVMNMMRFEDIINKGAHAYKDWAKVFMKPKLNMNVLREPEDIVIIYVDELVGLRKEFSFRIENGSHLIKDPAYLRFKESLSKLRSRYRKEKLHAYYIYKLQTKCSHLCDLINAKNQADLRRARSESRDAVKLIACLMKKDGNEVNVDEFSSEEEVSLKTKRAKICLETVSRRLQSSEQRDRTSQAITEALLRKSDESNNLPTSILCLGLNPKSKKQFAENLDQNLLFQVDLSLCTQPESFFRCCCGMNMNTGLLLTEAVKKNPYSVVVFHKLEMAHMSVFSTVLSILDFGVAEDIEGNITSFENCVVVVISDLGNKEIISKLINRDFPKSKSTIDQKVKAESQKGGVECSESHEMVKQEAYGSSSTIEMGLRGLRFELLYRLDHMLLFDPFSDDQPNRFAVLMMKELEEKSHFLHKAFCDLLNLQKKQNEDMDEIMQHVEGALGEVLKIRS